MISSQLGSLTCRAQPRIMVHTRQPTPRYGTRPMEWPKVIATIAVYLVVSVAVAQDQESGAGEPCPHNLGQRLSPEEMKGILSDHQRWLERREPEDLSAIRANLCNIDLGGAELNEADLRL